MIARIIEYSVRNKFLVLLLTGMLVALGGWATYNIRLDAIPDLSDVQVIVVTEYQGQNPEVVDQQVTYPLTSALLSVPGAAVRKQLSAGCPPSSAFGSKLTTDSVPCSRATKGEPHSITSPTA